MEVELAIPQAVVGMFGVGFRQLEGGGGRRRGQRQVWG